MIVFKFISLIMLSVLAIMSACIMEKDKDTLIISKLAFLAFLITPMIYIVMN